MTAQEIYNQMSSFINSSSVTNSNWYVGIAEDIRDCLFSRHCVDEKNDTWIYRVADSHTAARNVEQALIDNLGTKGGSGGGSDATK